MFREVRCTNCHTLIAASQIELVKQIGSCPNCNEMFSIKNDTTFEIRLKNEVAQPIDFDLLVIPNYEMSLSFDYKLLPGVPKFIQNIIKIGIATQITQGCTLAIIIPIVLCFIFNFAPSLVLIALYFLICVFVAHRVIKSNVINGKVEITIKDQVLTIKNPKLKLQKNKNTNRFDIPSESNIEIKNIDQVFITAIEEVNGYKLNILLKDKTVLNPVYPLVIIEEALFIEQEIELFLHIKDERHQSEIHI